MNYKLWRASLERLFVRELIAHGDRDRLIPLSQGQKLFDAAHPPKQFVLLRGGDHNDPYPPEFYSALGKFLK